MKVLFVHKDFEPFKGGGGTARHIHGLASQLAHLGHDVRVLAPGAEVGDTGYDAIPLAREGELLNQIRWADVVHVHGARSWLATKAALHARRLGKPFFYTPHCWYGPRSRINALTKWLWDHSAERFLLSRGAGTIILTPFWRDYLRAKRLPTGRTYVIPNCVLRSDVDRGLAARRRDDLSARSGLRILSIGRLSPEKRGCDMIRALSRAVLGDAVLDIVGKGPDRAAMEALVAELGLGDRVQFRGFVADGELGRLIGECDVFVLASEEEGLPTILLEMIIARIPIVVTNIPGNLAITEVAGIASTYDVGDIDELAALLARSKGVVVSDQAVQSVIDNFTWEARAPDIANLYRTAL